MTRLAWSSVLWLSLVVVGNGCMFGGNRPWTGPQSETLQLDPSTLASLDVRTDNGGIDFTGGAAGAPTVVATKRACGGNAEDAELALKEILVFVEPNGRGGQTIGWRWRRSSPPPAWGAEVSFDIRGPERADLVAETHNGDIDLTGVAGTVRAVSHNGDIRVDARGPALDAVNHNGEINVVYDGPRVSLQSSNGTITAELARCASLAGEIESHNGAIIATIGPNTSADWVCRTANGEVRFEPPATNVSRTGTRFTGRTGAGGTSMTLNTHNGEIHVKAGRE
jgi:hypothetical protein